jgi:hypothetical protein
MIRVTIAKSEDQFSNFPAKAYPYWWMRSLRWLLMYGFRLLFYRSTTFAHDLNGVPVDSI